MTPLRHKLLFLLAFIPIIGSFLVCGSPASSQSPLVLTPKSGGDGTFQTVTIEDQAYYQVTDFNGSPAPYIYFNVPDTYIPDGSPVYIQVFYREYGLGSLNIQYDSADISGSTIEQSYKRADMQVGTRLFDGHCEREAVFRLDKPLFAGRQNLGADLRVDIFLDGGRLTIRAAYLMTSPPPLFTQLADEPWTQPYEGPERIDIDATTLDGKVLCGYQGWFCLPRDGSQLGYKHWSRDSNRIEPGLFTFDMWSETREYSPNDMAQAGEMVHADDRPAMLYSAHRRGPVITHTQWMRQYGIDGVFLSRFVVATKDALNSRHVNMVLNHIREGCHANGRVWALMYDVSGGGLTTDDIKNDWKYLCDRVKIREDSRYLHHNGKPLVLIWGFGFNDRGWTAAQATEVIDFFKNDPVYGGVTLMGGVPERWRTLGGASFTEPEWAAVYRSFDIISPWLVGRFSTLGGIDSFYSAIIAPDVTETKSLGIGYVPVVWPGFSWDNLQNTPPQTSYISRQGGDFIWRQMFRAQSLDITAIFVAMFDEVDEGTAIFKVTNDPPVGNYFATYLGKPSDWYLRLIGTASQMFRGETPLTSTMPVEPRLPLYDSGAQNWGNY